MPLPRTVTHMSKIKRTTDYVSKSMSTFLQKFILVRLCLYSGIAILISAVTAVPQCRNTEVNQTLCGFAPVITFVLRGIGMPSAKKLGHKLL